MCKKNLRQLLAYRCQCTLKAFSSAEHILSARFSKDLWRPHLPPKCWHAPQVQEAQHVQLQMKDAQPNPWIVEYRLANF